MHMILHMSIVQLIEFQLIKFLKHLVEGKLRLTSHFTFCILMTASKYVIKV